MFCIICIRALYSWSIMGFKINHKFGINSSRKNVNNFYVTEIRYVCTVNQNVFPFLSVLLNLGYNIQEHYVSYSAFSNSK